MSEDQFCRRDGVILQGWREWHRCVQSSKDDWSRFEIPECLFEDSAADGVTEAACILGFLQHQEPARVSDRIDAGLCIEWQDGSQIDDLCFDSALSRLSCSVQRDVDHRTPGDDGHILAAADDMRLTDAALPAREARVYRICVNELADRFSPPRKPYKPMCSMYTTGSSRAWASTSMS